MKKMITVMMTMVMMVTVMSGCAKSTSTHDYENREYPYKDVVRNFEYGAKRWFEEDTEEIKKWDTKFRSGEWMKVESGWIYLEGSPCYYEWHELFVQNHVAIGSAMVYSWNSGDDYGVIYDWSHDGGETWVYGGNSPDRTIY